MEMEVIASLKRSTRRRECVCIPNYVLFSRIESSLMLLLHRECVS